MQDTAQEDSRNSRGYFKCQFGDCGLVFKTKATLKRYPTTVIPITMFLIKEHVKSLLN